MPRFFAVSNSLDKCHTFFLLLFSVFCWRMMEKREKKRRKVMKQQRTTAASKVPLQSEVFKTICWFNSILQTGNHLELRFSAQKRLSIRKHLRVAHSNCFIYSIGCKPGVQLRKVWKNHQYSLLYYLYIQRVNHLLHDMDLTLLKPGPSQRYLAVFPLHSRLGARQSNLKYHTISEA